jgi:C4-dicarboxylate transporter, DctQ subunit
MITFLHNRAKDVLVFMMVAMFVAFILQVIFRYLLSYMNLSVAWTEEVCVLAWMWGILWGAAFVNEDKEDIRFDMIYTMMSPALKRLSTIISSGACVAILIATMPATFSYIKFMKVESSNAMAIRLDLVFSIYFFFLIAIVVRHSLIVWRAILNKNNSFSASLEQQTTA